MGVPFCFVSAESRPWQSKTYNPDMFPRGGTPVTPVGKYPWMAMIERERYGRPQFWCGAVLISDQHVLTSARCLEYHA